MYNIFKIVKIIKWIIYTMIGNQIMDIIDILESKYLKTIEKRSEIAKALRFKALYIDELIAISNSIDDKKLATVFEAMEEITRTQPEIATLEWLSFSEKYIDSASNSLKRESSRIVGNIASIFEKNLDISIQKLLKNTCDDGTVVRWGSAYALARIIVLPCYANTPLFDSLMYISENETNKGVKNQYLKALKKATKLRK